MNHGEKRVGLRVTWKGKRLTQCTPMTESHLLVWALGHRTGWVRFIVHLGPEAEQTW